MREILFRGKRIDNGEWVEGMLVYNLEGDISIVDYINKNEYKSTNPIHPESVGQFTGLTDKDGNKIFDGDVLFLEFSERKPFPVFWDNDLFIWSIPDYDYVNDMPPLHFLNCHNNSIAVVGNIHDNPELIK